MLYELLSPYQGAMNLFSFITFRVALALATGLILTMLFGAPMIAWLRARQGKGQPIRADGPESHQSKKGTPTMGGFLILFGLLSVSYTHLRIGMGVSQETGTPSCSIRVGRARRSARAVPEEWSPMGRLSFERSGPGQNPAYRPPDRDLLICCGQVGAERSTAETPAFAG